MWAEIVLLERPLLPGRHQGGIAKCHRCQGSPVAMATERRHKIIPGADLAIRRQIAAVSDLPLERVGRIRMTEDKLPALAPTSLSAVVVFWGTVLYLA